jgi:hypothetical protein
MFWSLMLRLVNHSARERMSEHPYSAPGVRIAVVIPPASAVKKNDKTEGYETADGVRDPAGCCHQALKTLTSLRSDARGRGRAWSGDLGSALPTSRVEHSEKIGPMGTRLRAFDVMPA